MAKPDWGELQQRFLSEHAATGVSPKEWCEAQGLNYATARRYIKKPSAQTAQKKVRTAQKEQSAEELVDDDGLLPSLMMPGSASLLMMPTRRLKTASTR